MMDGFWAAILICIAFVLGCNAENWAMRRDAIRANVAHYDAATGEFKWGAR